MTVIVDYCTYESTSELLHFKPSNLL
ncbi:hypothetical protein SBDP1_500046 [Syntrophobacter sp. SbD1]|nr:hypothetical protein SBDP1_500046 [Syntrophobacter sp. SbD1]